MDAAGRRKPNQPAADQVSKCFPGFPVPLRSERIREPNAAAESTQHALARCDGRKFSGVQAWATYFLEDDAWRNTGNRGDWNSKLRCVLRKAVREGHFRESREEANRTHARYVAVLCWDALIPLQTPYSLKAREDEHSIVTRVGRESRTTTLAAYLPHHSRCPQALGVMGPRRWFEANSPTISFSFFCSKSRLLLRRSTHWVDRDFLSPARRKVPSELRQSLSDTPRRCRAEWRRSSYRLPVWA